MDEADPVAPPSLRDVRSDGVLCPSASNPKSWHVITARLPEPLPLWGSAYSAASHTPVSVLNLITALPLLLCLDRSHYTATLNNGPKLLADAFSAPGPRSGRSFGVVGRAAYSTDAATAAVHAVLNDRGTPSWEAKRQRLRQLALDSFFSPSLSARIAQRCKSSPNGGDGVRETLSSLLLHTRAVMSSISPTQAYLVDLFAAQIVCWDQSCSSAATEGPRASTQQAILETTVRRDDQAVESPSLSKAVASGRATSAFELHGIMTSGGSAPTSVMRSPRRGQEEKTCLHAPTTIAEQLLYIILRTSIAANTPGRSSIVYGEEVSTHLTDGLCTPPPHDISSTAGLTSAFSSTASPSVMDSLARKKPRLDGVRNNDGAIYSLGGEPSVYHQLRGAPGVRSVSTLPYQPQCWLAPSTVALVERSQALRRQQRWSCDLDPVIEATVAGEGSCAHSSHLPSCNYSTSATVISLLGSMQSSWAPLPGMSDSDDAASLRALVRDSGLSFSHVLPSAALDVVHAVKRENAPGDFHWESAMIGTEDSAVEALFSETSVCGVDSDGVDAHQDPGDDESRSAKQRETGSASAPLPVCRTPFVSCQPLYDEVVYAQVHLALHWCTAGFVDPFCLTYTDVTAGPNLPTLRVREEFNHQSNHGDDDLRSPSTAIATSGLTSLLEWGCTYGTLLRRLNRLCDLADDATQRGALGSYGRCTLSSLRTLLCLIQRQIGELGDQTGGPHRLSFFELLTAHQRLQRAVEQVDVLAVFFCVPRAATVSSVGQRASLAAESWDPVYILQQHCSSAVLLSRLYECYISRHTDTLGQNGGSAARYHELQQEWFSECITALGVEGVEKMPMEAKAGSCISDQQGQQCRDVLAALESGKAASGVRFPPQGAHNMRRARVQQRKEVLSSSMDAIGFLLRAALRPLNTMIHRWLTAGELADPYDEFFVVPSHGKTHSGFTLDLSPQRLPVFLSVAAATDFLHAGVSLRVLRAAAAHVVLSAKRDIHRIECMAEINESAAEDYMEELLDMRTLRRAADYFIKRLVRGGTEEDPALDSECAVGGTVDPFDTTDTVPLPLPPRVDVLSSYGDISCWKEHYQTCTRVMLDVVGEAANPGEGSAFEGSVEAAAGASLGLQEDEEEGLRGAAEAVVMVNGRVDAVVSSKSHPSDEELLSSHSSASPTCAASSLITVFMHSEDDEDHCIHGDAVHAAAGKHAMDNFTPNCSSPRPSSTSTTSVLGLRHITGSRFSTGTSLTSMASSRGTMALYGAITEELRQVAIVEQQTEAVIGHSRHFLRAEFDAHLWRRRRDGRLNDWKAQRLALRLRRVRAMESIVDELRDVYNIRAVGHADIERFASCRNEESQPSDRFPYGKGLQKELREGQESSLSSSSADAVRVVLPLRQLPPPRVAPPVILYAVDDDDSVNDLAGGRRGSRAHDGRSRRTSFAAKPTIIEACTTSAACPQNAPPFQISSSSPPLRTTMRQMPTVSVRGSLFPPGQQWRSASAGESTIGKCPKAPGPPPLAVSTTTRVPAAGPPSGSVPFVTPPLTGTGVLISGCRGSRSAKDREQRNAAPADLFKLEANRKDPVHQLEDSSTVLNVPSASTPSPASPQAPLTQRGQQAEAVMLGEYTDLAGAVSAVRCDKFGYSHPDALFKVSDINDEEFFLMRTGPKSYARRQAEEAAIEKLEKRQKKLASCSVDDPVYLGQIAAAAVAVEAAGTAACCEAIEDNAASPIMCPLFKRHDALSAEGAYTAAVMDYHAEEDDLESDSANCQRGDMSLPTTLDHAWQRDDPQRGSCAVRTTVSGNAVTGEGYTDELWSWTTAEAHRWYFDSLPLLHRVLTGAEVDRALLVDVALTCDEAEALQRCSGYYRALGRYTASFLTHKALQFTLLPPYGSLYRLTTQFLDVCLLQRAPIAVRLMDVWVRSVDAALEVIAEGEEAAMAQKIVREETRLSVLETLRDSRQGLDLVDALLSLNASFQREWATCVANGASTVTLEWRITPGAGEGHARIASAGEFLDGDVGFADGDEATESGGVGGSRAFSTSPQPIRLSRESREATPHRFFPVQSFLSSLSLTAVSPWCNGAWLLPDDILHCAGAIFRSLLFWKSAERIVVHAWRAGVDSGLSSVFFFCTTVRQVLVSSLQEALWARLTELTAAYRESLRFEAGVLYAYRALESFTIDHAEFMRECEFCTLCGPQFQRRVYPILQAMVSTVEEAERALRYAQLSIRIARRRCMATFRSMVSSGSSCDSASDSDEGARADSSRQTKGRPTDTSTSVHVFTPSRWCRRAFSGRSGGKLRPGIGAPQVPARYLQPLEDALARHSEKLLPAQATGGDPTDAATLGMRSELDSAHSSPQNAPKGAKELAMQAEQFSPSALRSSTTAHSTAPLLGNPLDFELQKPAAEEGEVKTCHEEPSLYAETPVKKRHRRGTQPDSGRRHSVSTTEPKSAAPRSSTAVRRPQIQVRSRSAGATVRQPAVPNSTSSPQSAKTGVRKMATPAMRQTRRPHRRGKRLSSAERKERRCKLRAIAERRISEEVDNQRRLMRDVVSRQSGNFASLTQSLRDALAEVMVEEDVRDIEEEGNVNATTASANGSSLKTIRDSHKLQQRRMDRYAFISGILRRLDGLIEVMACHV